MTGLLDGVRVGKFAVELPPIAPACASREDKL